jgi:oxygen-independent coproporphyrinogen-3 oxidase
LKSIHSELAGRHPEITVECNPSSVDEAHFSQLAELGVQRVSIGVQGLHEDRLKFLGRLHDAVDGLSAIEQAQRAGIPRISADLIFGVHTQGPQAAVLEAETVADSGVAHLSVYSLTIEPGTRFHARRKQGSLPLLAESLVAESYQAVESALEARGFGHYEISNYARNGQQSLHNLGYWMGRDYLGVGTGAVGTVVTPDGRVRYKNLLVPERYIEAWSEHVEHPFSEKLSEREQITAQISIDETLMLGLRTELGVDLAEMEHRHGTRLKREQEKVISELTDSGWFEVVNSRLRLRREKWLFADHAIRALL